MFVYIGTKDIQEIVDILLKYAITMDKLWCETSVIEIHLLSGAVCMLCLVYTR